MAWRAKPLMDRQVALARNTRVVGYLAGEGFAKKMDENFAFGPRTGENVDPRTRRRRSRKGEFPQEQTGTLRSAIYFEDDATSSDGHVRFKVGLSASESDDAKSLMEYLLFIEGPNGYGGKGSRQGLGMTAESKETHDAMLRNIADGLDPSRFRVGS